MTSTQLREYYQDIVRYRIHINSALSTLSSAHPNESFRYGPVQQALLAAYLPDKDHITKTNICDDLNKYKNFLLEANRIDRRTEGENLYRVMDAVMNRMQCATEDRQGLAVFLTKGMERSVESDFIEQMKVWEEDGIVEEVKLRAAFTISPQHRARLYFNKKYNVFMLTSNIITTKIVQRVVACVLQFLKTEDAPVLDGLCEALITEDQEKYERLLDEAYALYKDPLKEALFEEGVNTATKTIHKQMIDSVQAEMETIKGLIDERERSLRRSYKSLQGLQLQETSLNTTSKNSGEDFRRLLMACKENIKSIEASDSGMILTVVQPLLYYDQEHFRLLQQGGLFRRAPSWIQQLLIDIIEKETHTLYFQQTFALLYGEGPKRISTRSSLIEEGIPNPHIYYYDCWGDNYPLITKALSKGDFVTAYTQSIAAIAGINLTDTIVIDRFINTELKETPSSIPCLLDKESNKRITLEQYKEALESKEELNETH